MTDSDIKEPKAKRTVGRPRLLGDMYNDNTLDRKKYYLENKEKINNRGKIKIPCPICQRITRTDNMTNHQRTDRCKKYI